MLGDVYIKYDPLTYKTWGRLQFTFSSHILNDAKYMKHVALGPIYTQHKATPPWPNSETSGKN